jgi:hypothetical protein
MYRATPFLPFEIHMADGRKVSVDHPEVMAINPSGRTIIVYHNDGTFEVIDLLLVTTLKASSNGSHRRPKSRS